MRVLLLALLLGLAHPALAYDASSAAPAKSTATVQVLDFNVSLADVTVRDKKTYAYILFDALPYKPQIEAVAKAQGIKPGEQRKKLVEALAQALIPVKWPKLKKFKADVVEFPSRDEYGMPKWEDVRKLEKVEGVLKKK